jgi:hypothetical protein
MNYYNFQIAIGITYLLISLVYNNDTTRKHFKFKSIELSACDK